MYYLKFQNMLSAIKSMNDEENKTFYLDTVQQKIDYFEEYVEKVFKMVTLYPILDARYEGQELQNRKMDLDNARKIAHDAAITTCSTLNRICDLLKVEKFCPDPEMSDRTEIADFIGRFVYEVYLIGTGHVNGMDDIIKEIEAGNIKLEKRKVVKKNE